MGCHLGWYLRPSYNHPPTPARSLFIMASSGWHQQHPPVRRMPPPAFRSRPALRFRSRPACPLLARAGCSVLACLSTARKLPTHAPLASACERRCPRCLCDRRSIVLKDGGPCIEEKDKGAGLMHTRGKIRNHLFYAGPTCKGGYERTKTRKRGRRGYSGGEPGKPRRDR